MSLAAFMPAWLQWTLLGLAGWLAVATVLGFSLARFLKAAAGAPRGTSEDATADRSRRRVLVVDDDDAMRLLLRTTLVAGDFEVQEVGSAEEAREVMPHWRPAVVLLDFSLPGIDGLTFCAELAVSGESGDAAVILLTGEKLSDAAARLAGASALIRKPFSPLELLALIDTLTRETRFVEAGRRAGEEQLLVYARDLGHIATAERRQRRLLQQAYRQTATALAGAVEARDSGTGLHAQRVQRYALLLAEAVDKSLLQDASLEYGFLLHDVGKIGVSDRVLLKAGPLDNDEVAEVRAHPAIGARILGDVAMLHGAGLDVVRHHHERWDGAGYPDGLAAHDIPLSARIFAIADALDAMTSDRPYRDALGWLDAVEEILAQSGRQFDPGVVQAFAAREPDLRRVHDELSLVA
jgi:response regulator RpfG family c-di-GMP phosphodiesterase